MTKEKIIYLGPEEELTNVRERLENTDAVHIILVIPPQTQLRSHVGWRLLRSRVRELGQDVLIISSDRQIRAVAKAAGFRVADSLESSPSDRPRHTNRSVRGGTSGKTSQTAVKQGNNGNRSSRSLQPDRQQVPLSPAKDDGPLGNSENKNISRESDAITSHSFEIEEVPYNAHFDEPMETISPHYGAEDENEFDPLVADFYVARSIREAAQSTESNPGSTTFDEPETSDDAFERSTRIPPFVEIDEDSWVHEGDPGIHDIIDEPTDVHEAEVADLTSRQEQAQLDERSSRPSLGDFGNEDDLIPTSDLIEDRPTIVTPPPQMRQYAVSSTAKREPQPIIQPSTQARKVPSNITAQRTGKPASTKTSRVVTNPPLMKQSRPPSNGKGRTMAFIASIGLGILLLAFLLFLIFGFNATVTVVVPSQVVSVTNQYVASMNPPSGQQNTIPSQVLTYTATARGQGTVSGSSKQGNQVATGIVTFTNTGKNQLDIPSGTVLSTNGTPPVLFVTAADVLVQPGTNNAIPSIAPVQAQQPGDSGNVPAHSIAIIPPDSLTKIAQNNPGVTAPTPQTLAVTNANPTTGGGATNVPAVTSADANTLAASLQSQIQNEVSAWMRSVVHPGDVAGTPVPNVLTSATPLPQETFVTTPAIGQPSPGGKFTGVLTARVSLLVIRNATIQATGRAQLTTHALHMNPPSALATSMPVTVKVTKSTPSQDGKSITVVLESTGHVVQQVSTQQISQQLAGKSVDDAKSYINSGPAGITEVVNTDIVVFPPFLWFMPFRSDQIHVVIQPGPVKGATNG